MMTAPGGLSRPVTGATAHPRMKGIALRPWMRTPLIPGKAIFQMPLHDEYRDLTQCFSRNGNALGVNAIGSRGDRPEQVLLMLGGYHAVVIVPQGEVLGDLPGIAGCSVMLQGARD